MSIEYISRYTESFSKYRKLVSKKKERFSICMAGVSVSYTRVSASGAYGDLYLGCMHKKSRSLLNGFSLYAIVF
ncbi:hypothetical protein D1614_03865 [Maribellus luteus]|uniref:Uncharacterized protein n=1 Tax=Maribellus luteus TaxID=2305463 RepID=A0A399T474_9BACT|nr:hypothetical protein D1614_03865 [Maribellus luteus]